MNPFDRKRTQFTMHGITPEAVLQLRQYVQGDLSMAHGDACKSLHERKLCDVSGHFKVTREEGSTIVASAYAEGWHVNYKAD